MCASLSLWLDPAFGFPVVLLCAAAGAGTVLTHKAQPRFLRWSLIGAGVTLLAWLIDQGPWDPSASELRYVHPWYGFAWLGLGLGLDGWQKLRLAAPRRTLRVVEILATVPLIAPLVVTQLRGSYAGWLFTDASMRRLTSLDETRLFNTAFAWLADASSLEIAFVTLPVLVALAALVAALARRSIPLAESSFLLPSAIVFAGVVMLALFKVRWGVIASVLALPLIWDIAARAPVALRKTGAAISIAFVGGLLAWNRNLPDSLDRPTASTTLTAADLQALVHRHFAHWMATHHPERAVAVLAPPELSDSLIFHGGSRVLLSTAWESHRGHVAASRVLSAPENTEAEAVLESLGLTHVVLTSWDPVLPLLVRDPDGESKDTLYTRLQRWMLPRFLRAIPYHLPPVPGYRDQKLAVFAVTEPQDEALALSRLAEYFVEMDRAEPAGLVARALTESFPDDPNAVIARATVYEHLKDGAGFARELERLADDATAGKAPLSWDRRVQRAIVLVLGRRTELARAEIEACVASASSDEILDLTPLQAHRLRMLARHFGAVFRDPDHPRLMAARGSEYSSGSDNAMRP